MEVARLADEQWGVVSVEQLRRLGIGDGARKHQAALGRLRRLHVGVYALGHEALRAEGRWLAAVLACGEGAVLSHRSAAALWELRPSAAAAIDVTAPRTRHGRPGLRVHRPRGLSPQDVAERDGIPVTSIARTLLDLAAELPLGDLEATVARAQPRPEYDAAAVADVLARGGGHRGVGRLARVLALDPRVTRSALERRFLALVRRAGLPAPETNVWVTVGDGEEIQVDALWRAQRVTVELDSWTHHRDRRSFEADRARAAALTAAGFRHLQLTWRQVTGGADVATRTLRRVVRGRAEG